MDEWLNSFHNVKVLISDVLERLITNRDKHRELFEEAVEGWRTTALKALEHRVNEIKAGRHFDLGFSLPIPEDHTEDYNRVIELLEMTRSAGEVYMTLDQSQAAQYLRDDWAWKQQWTATNAMYTQHG